MNVKLMKINPLFGVDDEVLLSCETNNPSVTTCSNGRVFLESGNGPSNH